MAFGITQTGYIRPTFSDIIDQLRVSLQSNERFGANFAFDTNSNNYQFMAAIALQIAGLEERIEQFWTNSNVTTSEGNPLDLNVKLIGLSRQQGVRSTGTVTFTGVSGTLIPSNFQVSTTDLITFTTDTTVSIPAGGTIDVGVTASNIGTSGNVNASTITSIVSPLIGLSSVTNASATTGGQDIELDTELRTRHRESTALGAGNTVDAIKARVDAVTGVQDSIVTENDTNATVGTLPSKSVNVLVQGGADSAIGQAIFDTKPGGIQAFGTTTVNVLDSQGNSHAIGFSRPTQKTIHYRFTLTTTSDYPADGNTQITNAVVTFTNNLGIGDDVFSFKVSEAIADLNLIGLNNVAVELSEDGATYVTTSIAVGDTEIANTVSGNVVVQ